MADPSRAYPFEPWTRFKVLCGEYVGLLILGSVHLMNRHTMSAPQVFSTTFTYQRVE
jgi:hypothetical protein